MPDQNTLTIVPSREHPSRLDPTARAVWDGPECDISRRFMSTVYSVKGGFLLTWSEPYVEGQPWRSSAVLELFGSVAEAQAAWRVLGAEVPA